MTLQFTLPPHLEQRLHDEASRRGISAEMYTVQLLEQHLPPADRALARKAMFDQWEAEDRASEDECAARIRAAKTLDEAFAIAALYPEVQDDYDILAALDANHRAMGERPLFPSEIPEEVG